VRVASGLKYVYEGGNEVGNFKRYRAQSFLIFAIAVIFLTCGCGNSSPESAKSSSAPIGAPVEKKLVLAEKPGAWKADGVIADNEYSKVQIFGELEVYSRIDGDMVRLALKAKTNGYVAIGFDPSERMKDADIILGFVKDGQAVLNDMYSTGVTGPHPPDDQQGGQNNVTVFGGSKKDGVTVIEFERKLVTGDSKDKVIKIGENKVIWAVGDAETAAAKHIKRGSGVLIL